MEDKSLSTIKELSGQDFIMNNEVLGIIKKYMNEEGKPEKVIEALSGGYVGYANICNLLGDWTNILAEDENTQKKRKERNESNDLNESESNLKTSSSYISLNNKRLKQSRDGKEDFQTDISLLIKNKIKEMIISKFDTKKADTIFEKGENSTLVWLDFMIEHENWRKMLYELSEKYSDSLMLNFAIQRVSEAGYQREIASLSTASTFFPVFNKVLQQTLQSTFAMDDLQLSLFLPDLLKMCCHSQHTYFYTQLLLLLLLQNNPQSYNLRTLFLLLRDNALEKESFLVSKIHQSIDHQLHLFPTLSQPLFNILLAKKSNSADLAKIEREYNPSSSNPNHQNSSSHNNNNNNNNNSNNNNNIDNNNNNTSSSNILLEKEDEHKDPLIKKNPSVKYIRDPLFLKILIQDLFDPKANITDKNLSKYFYLLSYASVVDEDKDDPVQDNENIKETMSALLFSYNLCKLNLFDQDFQRSLPTLTNYLKSHPVVSVGVLHWVQLSLLENDSGTISLSLPYLLLLIRYICFYQPLQRDKIISIIEQAFDKERSSFDVLASVNFRKKLLNTILYVLRCGHVVQVLFCIQKLATRHDSSLIRFFLDLVIGITEPPFSEIFLKYMLELIAVSMPTDLSSLQSWEEKVTPFLNLIPSHLLENDFNLLHSKIKSSFSHLSKHHFKY